MIKENSIITCRKTAGLICLLLLLMPFAVNAVDYYVFGQVFRIDSVSAADTSIANNALVGAALPFAHVKLFNSTTGAYLAQADAGMNGQFTIKFTQPAAPPGPNIECRVYKVLDGSVDLIPAARVGINHYASIAQYQGVALKVISDESVEYGDAGFRFYPGIGIVFTRVGMVEIPYLAQNATLAVRPVSGLADFTRPVPVGVTNGVARAAELGITAFKQAPFGGRLLIYGDFGLPGGIGTGKSIDYYQVKIKKINEVAAGITYDSEIICMDPLSKVKTEVVTWPIVKVKASTEKLGPFAGVYDDLATLPVESNAIDGLYKINRNVAGTISSTFYSFPDLRINWVSSNFNGLYEFSLRYFTRVGGSDSNPQLQELPASCFAGAVPIGDANYVALHKLNLRTNNQALDVRFNSIYLKNKTTGRYFKGTGIPDVATAGTAFNFNTEGLCDIINLAGQYNMEIDFTARHAGNYMRNYNLRAVSNDNSVTVNFDSDVFTNYTTDAPPNPFWSGTTASGWLKTNTNNFTQSCAYIIYLDGVSRVQDGIHYIQYSYPRRAYYINP